MAKCVHGDKYKNIACSNEKCELCRLFFHHIYTKNIRFLKLVSLCPSVTPQGLLATRCGWCYKISGETCVVLRAK